MARNGRAFTLACPTAAPRCGRASEICGEPAPVAALGADTTAPWSLECLLAHNTGRSHEEYMLAQRSCVPDYRTRWRACCYIGSGQVGRANDLLVVRRQKRRGMHW